VVIAPGEAHLFLARLEEARDPALLESWQELLSPDERARGARYAFERNRHEHLVAHALKRRALSRFAPEVDPRDWRFVAGDHGKPSVAAPETRLRFNLSHTEGLVACLVALDAEVGVDVEQTARRSDTVGIADRFFAAPEVEALRALPEAEQRGRFFEYWTLKEAYIKARGLGLALPLGGFWFALAPPAPPAIGFAPSIVDQPARWSFFQGWVEPSWRVAACVERLPGASEPRIIAAAP
jgi:4'-phosphopantetheinyl transferase